MTGLPTDLEFVVAQTLNPRYRDLCAETYPEHMGYRRVVAEMAAIFRGEAAPIAEPPPTAAADPPSREPITLAPLAQGVFSRFRLQKQRIDTCLYRTVPSCGCAPATCHAGRGGLHGAVSFNECKSCLAALDKPRT